MALQVLHITDLHLIAEIGATLHGWRVHDAFEAVLSDALTFAPNADALLLGGDLVDDRSPDGYHWLNQRLRDLPMPVLAVAGNHDTPETMAHTLTAATIHGRIELDGWRIIGLNSHCPGTEAGRIGMEQLDKLARTLAADPRPVLVCVHHPAWPIGSDWQDSIGLADRDALIHTLAEAPNARAVVCGHAHQAGAKMLGDGLAGYLTAATMRQFLPGAQTFAEDPVRAPGYRVLRLDDNGGVTSTHRRVIAATRAYRRPS